MVEKTLTFNGYNADIARKEATEVAKIADIELLDSIYIRIKESARIGKFETTFDVTRVNNLQLIVDTLKKDNFKVKLSSYAETRHLKIYWK